MRALVPAAYPLDICCGMLEACQRRPGFSRTGILLFCHAAYILCKLLTTWLSRVQQRHPVFWLKSLHS